MKRVMVCAAVACAMSMAPRAQDSAASAPGAPVVAAAPQPKPVAPEARQLLMDLQLQDRYLRWLQGLIQKERDTTAAEYARQVAALEGADPGYTLDRTTLMLMPKRDAK